MNKDEFLNIKNILDNNDFPLSKKEMNDIAKNIGLINFNIQEQDPILILNAVK